MATRISFRLLMKARFETSLHDGGTIVEWRTDDLSDLTRWRGPSGELDD
jgi:hypothetical protein